MTEKSVHTEAITQVRSRLANTMAINKTSGGIGNIELSKNATTAKKPIAKGCEASDMVQLYNFSIILIYYIITDGNNFLIR